MTINYKSDFDFILTLRDAQGNDIGYLHRNFGLIRVFSILHI
jgi:hypothetical protein